MGILDAIKKWRDNQLKCPYWKKCKHYQKDGATCNDGEQAVHYCGIARDWSNRKEAHK